jgi:hypothetical protein
MEEWIREEESSQNTEETLITKTRRDESTKEEGVI